MRIKTLLTLSCLCWVATSLYGQQPPVAGAARLVPILNTRVASEAPGIVRSIEIKVGQMVSKDDVLVRLNDEMFVAEFDVASAEEEIASLEATNRVNIEYAEKSAEVAAAILEKSLGANRLFAKAIPATEIQKLQLELEQARLSGEQAMMELDVAAWTQTLKERKKHAAEVRLSSRKVNAPFEGKIAQLFVQPGQWVNAGEPIVRLLNSDRLRAEAFFNEDLVREVKIGQQAIFEYTLAGEEVKVPAEITFVSSEIVEGIFQVWAEFENPTRYHLAGTEGQLVLVDGSPAESDTNDAAPPAQPEKASEPEATNEPEETNASRPGTELEKAEEPEMAQPSESNSESKEELELEPNDQPVTTDK